MAVLVLQ